MMMLIEYYIHIYDSIIVQAFSSAYVISDLLQSLFNLTPADPYYMIDTVLPTLLDMLNSIDLNVRHGAVLATAEILEALYNHFNDKIELVIGESPTETVCADQAFLLDI